METKVKSESAFKTSDSVLEKLVKERREEVVTLQQSEASQNADIQKRAKASMEALKKTLPKEMVSMLEAREKTSKDEVASANYYVEEAKDKLTKTAPVADPEVGITGKTVVEANAVGFFTPYYGTLHGSNGTIYWQGYNPGNIDLSDAAAGAGSGLFGGDSFAFTVYMDWWFTFTPPQTRNYSQYITIPFHGFYILTANDGWLDSKDAHARIDMSAVGYQYNYKATSSVNIFDLDRQNINVNARFDGSRSMLYSDLLAAPDPAFLRVTASFYVYARGGGSTAQLNFSSGAANYVGIPSLYVI